MEVAHIDGRVIVVPLGLYHVGQMVVFVEIDGWVIVVPLVSTTSGRWLSLLRSTPSCQTLLRLSMA